MRMAMHTVRQLALSATMITVLFIGGVLYPRAATAATYYIATTGSDSNPCTLAQPCLTFPKGVSKLQGGGDILYLRAGAYNTGSVNFDTTVASGTSWSNAILISAYPGETVVGNDLGVYTHDPAGTAQYIIFKDFTLTGAQGCFGATNNPNGLNVFGDSYMRFVNIDCSNWAVDNIGVFIAANHVEVIGGKVHDSAAIGPNFNYNHGFYILGAYNILDGVEIYNNYGLGGQFYNGNSAGSASAHDNILRNCRIHDNHQGGFVLDSGDNNLAYNNLVYNHLLSFGLDSSISANNTQFYNNTTYGNAGGGIHLSNGGTRGVANAQVKNNIVMDTIVDTAINTTFATNLCPSAGTGCTVVGNPLFVNATAGDFSLQVTSPAIDIGTSIPAVPVDIRGTPRPQGARYDIGAYEYQGGLQAPTNLTLMSAP